MTFKIINKNRVQVAEAASQYLAFSVIDYLNASDKENAPFTCAPVA